MKTRQEHIDNIAAIADLAAKAALAELRKTQPASGCIVFTDLLAAWENDAPAREAFARRAIELYLEQEGEKDAGMPSVEALTELFISAHNDSDPAYGDVPAGVCAVRNAILSAILPRAAKNALALAKIRKLPGQWQNENVSGENDCPASVIAWSMCSELEAALAGLEVEAPTAPADKCPDVAAKGKDLPSPVAEGMLAIASILLAHPNGKTSQTLHWQRNKNCEEMRGFAVAKALEMKQGFLVASTLVEVIDLAPKPEREAE